MSCFYRQNLCKYLFPNSSPFCSRPQWTVRQSSPSARDTYFRSMERPITNVTRKRRTKSLDGGSQDYNEVVMETISVELVKISAGDKRSRADANLSTLSNSGMENLLQQSDSNIAGPNENSSNLSNQPLLHRLRPLPGRLLSEPGKAVKRSRKCRGFLQGGNTRSEKCVFNYYIIILQGGSSILYSTPKYISSSIN